MTIVNHSHEEIHSESTIQSIHSQEQYKVDLCDNIHNHKMASLISKSSKLDMTYKKQLQYLPPHKIYTKIDLPYFDYKIRKHMMNEHQYRRNRPS